MLKRLFWREWTDVEAKKGKGVARCYGFVIRCPNRSCTILAVMPFNAIIRFWLIFLAWLRVPSWPTKQEARIIELEQQVWRLQAEVRKKDAFITSLGESYVTVTSELDGRL